jgi:hypothetical protein
MLSKTMTAPSVDVERNSQRDGTSAIRRHAVWLAPALALIHSVFTQALLPGYWRAHLAGIAAAFLGGLAFRRTQRATRVLIGWIAIVSFSATYLFGVVAPTSYLAFSGRSRSLWWAIPAIIAGLGSFLAWRVCVSLRNEWSQPLGDCPGVRIGTEGFITYERVVRRQPITASVACALVALFVPALFLTRNTPDYLPLVMMGGPWSISLLVTDSLAYLVAFYLSVRRWEDQHGTPLRFPALR